jgi:trehalose synthase
MSTTTDRAGQRRRAHGPHRIRVRRKALEDYRALVGDDLVAEARELGRELRGLRVMELSSTATGGGVAELLSSLVPLQHDVGLDVEWHVITAGARFFEITKRLHNGLQGMPVDIDDDDREIYLRANEVNARALGGEWDVVVVHDPQPAAVRRFAQLDGARWLWRCHVDSSSPHPPVWAFLRPFVEEHELTAFTLQEFVPRDLAAPVRLLVPAIDPLSSKNRELPGHLARQTVAELGVDLHRPLLLQVSRFDPWKDPLGVVDVWRRARGEVPGLQLALVGSMAGDDPEGWRVYHEVERATAGDDDCFLFTNQMGVTSHEVNALQRVADVVIQKSIREGFGLIVAETLWKGTALVAGPAGGIPLQLTDGVSGYLARGEDEFVGRVLELLEHPSRARDLGAAGARGVRAQFLMPRLLRDALAVLRDLARSGRSRPA